jgi:hypothetical protein
VIDSVKSANPGQPWAPADVYFGSPENQPPDWRDESTATDEDDDSLPSPEDLASVAATLGFDPAELFGDEGPGDATTENVYCPTGPGGGSDPSCSAGGGGSGLTAGSTNTPVLAPLSQKESDAVDLWKLSNWGKIKTQQRNGGELGAAFNSALDKLPIHQGESFRGITVLKDSDMYDVGKVVNFRTSESFSKSKDFAEGWAEEHPTVMGDTATGDRRPVMFIVPKNSDFRDIGGIQDEVVNKPGFTARVDRVDDSGPVRHIYLAPTPVGNVYCPTGPGGGTDPSCGAGGGGSSSSTPLATKDQIDAMKPKALKELADRVGFRHAGKSPAALRVRLQTMLEQGQLHAPGHSPAPSQPAPTSPSPTGSTHPAAHTSPAGAHADQVLASFKVLHTDRSNAVSLADLHAHTGLPLSDLHKAVNDLRRGGVLSGSQLEGGHGDHGRELAAAIREHDQHISHVHLRTHNEQVDNVFCGTGPGGGVDPSCGAGAGSGSPTYTPRSGEGNLYGTRPGAGESDEATRTLAAANRAKDDHEFGAVYADGAKGLGQAAQSVGPEFASLAALARDIVRANTPARQDVEVRFKPKTGAAAVWAGTNSFSTPLILESHGRGVAVTGRKGRTLLPTGVTPEKAAVLLHKAAGYTPPSDLDVPVGNDDAATGNVFCGTGPGGGQDPSCTASGHGASSPARDYTGTTHAEHLPAARAMVAMHPFPGPAPRPPPGTGRPDLRAKNPELQAAYNAHQAWAAQYHTAYTAHAVHRLLAEPAPKPVPPPDRSLPLARQNRLGVKAKEQADAAKAEHDALTTLYHGAHAAVERSHVDGAAALAAAREVARERAETTKARADEHRASYKQAKAEHKSSVTGNVFCPTGPGGGQDPSCARDSGGGTVAPVMDKVEIAKTFHQYNAASPPDKVNLLRQHGFPIQPGQRLPDVAAFRAHLQNRATATVASQQPQDAARTEQAPSNIHHPHEATRVAVAALQTKLDDLARQKGELTGQRDAAKNGTPERDALSKRLYAIGNEHEVVAREAHDLIRAAVTNNGDNLGQKVDANQLPVPSNAKGTILDGETAKARSFLDGMVRDAKAPAVNTQLKFGGRPQYAAEGMKIMVSSGSGAAEVVHEYGHHLEFHVPGVKEAALDFHARRTAGEPPTSMAKAFPDGRYAEEEHGYKDDFAKTFSEGDDRRAFYVGKKYANGATEIVSMGLEKMYKDPVKFAHSDPEYFTFITGLLSGHSRKK